MALRDGPPRDDHRRARDVPAEASLPAEPAAREDEPPSVLAAALKELALTVFPIAPAWIWAAITLLTRKAPWIARATKAGTMLPGWSDGVLILVIGAALFFFASAFASLATWNRSRAAPVSDAERGCVAALVRAGGIGFSYWAAYLLAHAA